MIYVSDNIVCQFNEDFDSTEDYLGAKLTLITNHRFTSCVVEFHTEYSAGDTK